MTGEKVVGERALRKMAGMALNSGDSQGDEIDAIDQALATKKKIMAGDIISIEVAKSQAERLEAEAKAETAKAATVKAQAEASRAASGDEPGRGFKVTGGIDFGHLDLAQERKEASERLEKLKKEADDVAKATGQENSQLRDKIAELNLEHLTSTFQAQMEGLTKLIQASGSKKNFVEEMAEAQETAKALGFARPTPESSDLQTTLALKKIEFEQAVALRNLARDDRAEARRWQMELRRLDDERDGRKHQENEAQKSREMWGRAPTVIGETIAAGMMAASGKAEANPVGKAKVGKRVEAIAGEGGDFECETCKQPVAVGPTAKVAICAGCGAKYPIERKERVEPEEE